LERRSRSLLNSLYALLACAALPVVTTRPSTLWYFAAPPAGIVTEK
jgi:hypothetical protein